MTWNKANESWNRASLANHTYRAPKPRVMHGPVGEHKTIMRTLFAAGVEDKSCPKCHYHKCDCKRPKAAAPVAETPTTLVGSFSRDAAAKLAANAPADAPRVFEDSVGCRFSFWAGEYRFTSKTGAWIISNWPSEPSFFANHSSLCLREVFDEPQQRRLGGPWEHSAPTQPTANFSGELDWHQAKEAMRAGKTIAITNDVDRRKTRWRFNPSGNDFVYDSGDGSCENHSFDFAGTHAPNSEWRYRIVEDTRA